MVAGFGVFDGGGGFWRWDDEAGVVAGFGVDSSLALPKMDDATRSTMFSVPRLSASEDYGGYAPPATPSSGGSVGPLSISQGQATPRLPALGRFSPLKKGDDERPSESQRPELPDTISV